MSSSSSSSSSALLKQEFLKKWIKGVGVCRKLMMLNKNMMSISDRRKAIKLSADVAIASASATPTQWSRALISDVISRDGNNGHIVQQILHAYKVEKKRGALIACSNRIIRRCHLQARRRRRSSSSRVNVVPKLMVINNRTRVLKKLVPGGEQMNETRLIKETLDYIVSLRVQVDVMRRLAAAAHTLELKLDPSKTIVS